MCFCHPLNTYTQPTLYMISPLHKPMGSLRWWNATIRLKALLTHSIRCVFVICAAERRDDGICMLNAETINTWIIYNRMLKDRGQPEKEHRKFMMKLAEEMIFWAEERMSFQVLQRSTQMTIRDMYINIPHQRLAEGENPMKRCVFCPWKKDRKTRQQCIQYTASARCVVSTPHPSPVTAFRSY